VAENTKCPIAFSITQNDKAPRRWRQTLDTINEATARGLSITAQIAARPVGLLLGLELSRNPFQTHPSYRAIANLPFVERLARLHQPEVRAAILSESATATDDPLFFRPNYDKMYLLGNPPDYEQSPENTLGAQARRQGRQPEELAYDAMLTEEGRGMLYVPFLNYSDGNLDATREMLRDPNSVPGLSDGGAHCGIICDASFPTYLLTHWTRDRSRGEKLSIPFVVAAQARKTALSVGLYDRGVIAPGFKADVNVIDYDKLHLHPPKVHYDLPVGGRRLMQQVTAPRKPEAGAQLTDREREVLRLVADGLPTKQISASLSITERTVKFHVNSILRKLGADNRAQAVALAAQRGLL